MNEEKLLKEIEAQLEYARGMEEAFRGNKEPENFYSGMIHGLGLIKLYIKRKSKTEIHNVVSTNL